MSVRRTASDGGPGAGTVAADIVSLEQLRNTSRATITVEETGAVLGISRGAAYQAVRNGEIPALRLGCRWLVPVPRLLAMLGVGEEDE